MSDSEDKLHPVTLIEGLNEGEECDVSNPYFIYSYKKVGLEYTPKVGFDLSRAELYLVNRKDAQHRKNECGIEICSDYNGKPTNKVLSKGVLIYSEMDYRLLRDYSDWYCIEFNYSLRLFPDMKYWISLESEDVPFHLGKSKEGTEVGIYFMSTDKNKWNANKKDYLW